MAQKWNLQDIRPIENKTRPSQRQAPPAVNRHATPVSDSADDVETIIIEDGNKRKSGRLWMLGILAIILIGGAFTISVVFSETTVTVHPEFRQPNVNAEFEATKEKREGGLTYEVLTVEESGEQQVKATGQKEVKQQTKGTLEIFKTTAGAERLVKNTRFKSPTGLIFKVQESVVVPGAIEKDGKLVPGSIRAEVFAESVGQEYNLPKDTRFSIPGFEESGLTDLYKAMYAVNSEAFSGGFSGPQFIIDDTELNTARQALQIDLRNKLLEKVVKEQPAGFVSFPGSYSFTYTAEPAVSFGNDLVTIKERAVLQVPLFKSGELASFVAAQTVPTYNKAPVRIESYDGMLFSYADPALSTSVIANLAAFKFTLVGKPLIIWEYNADTLRKDLAGKPKTAIATVLTGYTGIIKSAQVSIKPFYRRSFPSDGTQIVITEVLDEEK